MTYFVEADQFKQMISYQPYVTTKSEKKKVKYTLMDSIKEAIGEKWTRFKEGTRQTFDMICFLSAELGFVYAGGEYLADRHSISSKTVSVRMKELEDLGQVIKVHRRAKRCNGRGKPIYLFVNHPYFRYWVDLLGINLSNFHTDFHTENDETPSESKDETTKKVSTYSLPLQQESNINIENESIVKYVFNRVQDSVKKGTKIKYLSSYINRVVSNLERQALYAENMRQSALKKQQEVEASKKILELEGIKTEGYKRKVPFYNWLES